MRYKLYILKLRTEAYISTLGLPSDSLTNPLTDSTVCIMLLETWQRWKNHTLAKILQDFRQQVNWPTLLGGNKLRSLYIYPHLLGADFKNNQRTKQVNDSIWTNRKQVKICFYLPIGPNKNCLIVLLFDWLFIKSAPWLSDSSVCIMLLETCPAWKNHTLAKPDENLLLDEKKTDLHKISSRG